MFKRQHLGERAQTHARLNMFRTPVKRTMGKAKIAGYYFVAYPSQNGNKPKVFAYSSSQRALDSKVVKKCDRKKGKILEYLSVYDMKDDPSVEVEKHKQACIRTVSEQAFVDLHDIREKH